MLWLLVAVAMFFQVFISCITGVDYGCDTLANASTVVGLGAVMMLLMLALIRYVFGGAIFTLWRTRALMTDLAGHGGQG
jgi:hypothetical protein